MHKREGRSKKKKKKTPYRYLPQSEWLLCSILRDRKLQLVHKMPQLRQQGISVCQEMSWHKHDLLWLWSPLRAQLVAPSHPILWHNNIQRFNLQSRNRKNESRSPKVNFNYGIWVTTAIIFSIIVNSWLKACDALCCNIQMRIILTFLLCASGCHN